MRYGIYAPNFGPYGNARVLAALAHDAEDAGWDGFFTWDHIAGERWPSRMVDPWVALAAIALHTARIRIGALVTPLPRRRPHKVARESVSIDRLSNGRLIFGVGIGDGQAEWADFGEEPDMRVRGNMLDEALEVLAGLWSGEPFSHDGTYYSLKDAQFLPKPVQQPRIPIWVAGTWPNKAPFRRAARWDGAFPNSRGVTPDALRDLVAFVGTRRESRTPFDVVRTGSTPGNPAEDADIIGPYADAGLTWWLEMIGPVAFGAAWQDEIWPLARMRARILAGPPKI